MSDNTVVRVSFVVCSFLVFSAFTLAAQDIKVLEQSGVESGGGAAKETQVIFITPELDQVGIYKLLSESAAVATGSGGTISVYGVELQFLCNAPAKISMPGGVYNLYVTDNAFYGMKFQIKATGGVQTWKVSNPQPWKFIVGVPLACVGAGLGTYGMIMYGVGTSKYDNSVGDFVTVRDTGDLILGIVGIGCAIGGLILGLDSGAKAELINSN